MLIRRIKKKDSFISINPTNSTGNSTSLAIPISIPKGRKWKLYYLLASGTTNRTFTAMSLKKGSDTIMSVTGSGTSANLSNIIPGIELTEGSYSVTLEVSPTGSINGTANIRAIEVDN